MKTIHPKTFSFLKQLKSNNNRDWFTAHKSEFDEINQANKQLFSELNERMNEHDKIERLKVFRVYRDVRFSKDKTPYKTNFGASFVRKKPELRGGYYVHLESDNSFLAIGFWKPEKDDLFRIRKEIELNGDEFTSALSRNNFKSTWGNLQGETLKVAPKGFDKEDKYIKLLRNKQFYFTIPFADKEVLSANFVTITNQFFQKARPFMDFMTEVLTTDLNGQSIL